MTDSAIYVSPRTDDLKAATNTMRIIPVLAELAVHVLLALRIINVTVHTYGKNTKNSRVGSK